MAAVTNTQTGASAISGLGRALVQNGRLRAEQADSIAKAAAAANTPFIDQLIASKILSPRELATSRC
jgi:type IV pilus assembly protein PilB